MASLFSKFKQALSKSSSRISEGINNIFLKKKIDSEALNDLEELLITNDITTDLAKEIIAKLKNQKFNQEVQLTEIKEILAQIIYEIVSPAEQELILLEKNNIILFCGVNGNGKTTTIGKLARLYKNTGKNIVVAACDTFRVAAVEQLETWTMQSNIELIRGATDEQPSSVAYKATKYAIDNNAEILLIDTAGRLQNYKNLMDELGKIIRAIKKLAPSQPSHSLLVIDGMTGQNALKQVEEFKAAAEITGVVITKLDGTAKAGILLSIIKKFNIPVYFIGIGEKIDDLKPFNAKDFVRSLLDLN